MTDRSGARYARPPRVLSLILGALLAVGGIVAVPQVAHAADTVAPIVEPSVSGDCVVFQTRTVDPGVWPEGYVVSAQWYNRRGSNHDDPYGAPGFSKKLSAALAPDLTGSGTVVRFWPVLTVTNTLDGTSFVWDGDLGCTVKAAPGNVLLSPPIILAGEVKVGSTVTMSTGEWAETDGWTFVIRWNGNKAPGQSTSRTFAEYEVGQKYRYVVRATKTGYEPVEALVNLPPVAKGPPPVPTVPPSVQGSPTVGSTITPSIGTWPVTRLEFKCGWYRDGVRLSDCGPITLTPADLGKTYYIRVIGERRAYEPTAPTTSAPVTILAGAAPVPVRQPVINGTTTVGEIITLDQGQWNLPPDAKFTYQWLKDGNPVGQKTSAAYVLGPSDAGTRLSVTVTVTAPGYTTATVTTSPTAPIGKGPRPVANSLPKISGTVAVGEVLTATPGTWSKTGLSFKYTWLRNGVPIAGMSGSTYKMTSVDLDAKISVRVTVTSTAWGTTTATSAATTKVAKGAAATVTSSPKILGTPKVGNRLTVSTGSWSRPSLTFTYQWFSNGNAIPGATSSAYTLKSAQKGKVITVKVVATRLGYNDGAAITKATTRVQ